METEQEIHEEAQNEEEAPEENSQQEQENEQVKYIFSNESMETRQKNLRFNNQGEDRSGFIHGLAVGLGIGCVATFIIVWISVFFTPQMPSAVTYENLLSIFIYPLIYLLAVGLIALTAGIVREYYATRSKF